MNRKLTRDYFASIAEELAQTCSQPEFVRRVDALRRVPEEERIRAGTTAYPEALRQAGVAVPETLRVAARTFERPEFAARHGAQRPGVEPGSAAASAWESYGSMIEEAYDGSAWGSGSDPLPEQPIDPQVVRRTVHRAVLAIADFVLSAPFHRLLLELYALPEEERPGFVLDAVLNGEERRRRGIVLPAEMAIQRSTFYDGRPTLFCISKKESLAYPWRKITITFDNETLG